METLKTKHKLLVATDTFYPKRDGVTIFLERVLPELSKNYDITIIAPEFSHKRRAIRGCNVVMLPITNKLSVANYKSIKFSKENRMIIKQLVKEADIVWSQDIALIGALAIYYGKKYKKHVITYVHQITWEQAVDVFRISKKIKSILSALVRVVVRYLYNKCDIVMIPYKELEEELRKKGIHSRKAVVQLGVDSRKFVPPLDKGEAKKRIGIPPEFKVIGYCGRLSKEKNLETLREAYKLFKKKNRRCCLLIVGNGPEKNEFKNIKDAIVTGFVKDTVPYYQAMDIFVMPSLTETTSLATLEAMSCGLTILSTKVGYIKSYIIHKVNGFFFLKEDAYILSKKIEFLLKNRLKRRLAGQEARNTVVKRFAWEKTIRTIKRILD